MIENQNVIIYIHQQKEESLNDYKFFCFNGEPKLCQVISDRRTDEKIDFYDIDWNRIVGLMGLTKFKNNTDSIAEPESLNTMADNASKLSKNSPFARIDFYEVDKKCYFGEITFYPASGLGCFKPDEWNEKIGDLIMLPNRGVFD